MDFLFYLTQTGQEIVNIIVSKNYKVLENSPICKKHKEVFGYHSRNNFEICTDNIKNNISPVKHYVNETVYHEAVHVAQYCKQGKLGVSNIRLTPEKLNLVYGSLQYGTITALYETEAYYLEDKPELVLSYLKKYCM